MPAWAHVTGGFRCPACGEGLAAPHDLIAFQWGYCASRQPWDPLFYRVEDAILWRLDDDGRIPAWAYFEGGLSGGNIGDPGVGDLSVRGFGLDGDPMRCRECSSGVGLRITAGRIVGLERANEGAEIVEIAGDGARRPRIEWDDAPMRVVDARSRDLADARGVRAAGKRAP